MTTIITEGDLVFTFPDGWIALQYDATAYYVNRFQGLAHSKGIDIIALSPGPASQLWLIEIKDYRAQARTKTIDIFDEVALKVRDSLAGLYAAGHCPDDSVLRTFARAIAPDVPVRVVLHLEQTNKPSRLRPGVTERQNHRLKLRQKVKAVDKRAHVCEIASQHADVRWAVSPRPSLPTPRR